MMRHDLCAGILQFLDRRLCGSLDLSNSRSGFAACRMGYVSRAVTLRPRNWFVLETGVGAAHSNSGGLLVVTRHCSLPM